jgi:hypothetical protein
MSVITRNLKSEANQRIVSLFPSSPGTILFQTGQARTRPDPESGQAILNLPDSHAESCRYFAPHEIDRLFRSPP